MAEPTGSSREGHPDLPERLVETLPDAQSIDVYGRLLLVLEGNGGSCSVAALARGMVDARERARTGEPDPPVCLTERYQSTYLSLDRQYLPVLVTLGVVEYDRMDGTVTLVPTPDDA